VHQTTLDSLVFDLFSAYDFMLSSSNVSEALINDFPELRTKFGDDAVCEIGFRLAKDKAQNAITLNTAQGIVYGDNTDSKGQRT
jgi:hypothetical protein